MPKHVAWEWSIAVTIIEWLLQNIILILIVLTDRLQFMDMICVVAYLWCVS